MMYVSPNQSGSKVEFRSRYQNFIGGEWVRPVKEQYFENITPVTGRPFCEVPRSSAEDVEKAIECAWGARTAWGKTSPSYRSSLLYKIADRIEQNIEKLAVAETWDCGKPIRETLATDLPLCVDYFRYFAGCIRSQEGTVCDLDQGTVAYNYHEPLGVVGQILPWTHPLLSAAWKLAPALAAGNSCVLKCSEYTPASLFLFCELVGDLLPPGVLNVVCGYGNECNKPLAMNKRVARLGYTGDAASGRLLLQCAAESLVPVCLELGGKAPTVFFADVFARIDEYAEKAMEAFSMFAYNQGEAYGCPSRVLVDEKIYARFLERAVERTRRHQPGNPLDPSTTVGAQVCSDQLDKVLRYIEVGKKEGAKVLLGGERARLGGDLSGGYYLTPTIFEGHYKLRTFQEDVCGPVACVTSFKDFDDAMIVANDLCYGLGAGVWTRDANTAYRACRGIQAGRVWTNCHQFYPAHAAFGGYHQYGFGREGDRTALCNYQQTKNMLVSYDTKPLGF